MAVMGEQDRGNPGDEAREEGDAVLRVDDNIDSLGVPDAAAACQHEQPRARIDAELRAGA